MATARAIGFTQNARTAATYAEFWYRYAKRLSQEWFASPDLATEIPNDATLIDDGNTKKPLTGADVQAIVTRSLEIIADFESASNAKLSCVLKASAAPWDWQI